MATPPAPPVPSEPHATAPLGILLISGGHERAHYAFMLATGAAALGRRVVLFATNEGCRALLPDAFAADPREATAEGQGVATLAELAGYAGELGIRRIACEAGLRMAGLASTKLAPGVETAGIATFLEATAGGQVITL
jgi:peroxiredoxin family protein